MKLVHYKTDGSIEAQDLPVRIVLKDITLQNSDVIQISEVVAALKKYDLEVGYAQSGGHWSAAIEFPEREEVLYEIGAKYATPNEAIYQLLLSTNLQTLKEQVEDDPDRQAE